MPSDHRDPLHLNRTAWWLKFVAIIPLVQGALFLLVSLLVVIVFQPQAPWELRLLFPLVGALVVCFGLLLLLSRFATTIDRENRSVTRWWGLLRPLWRTTASLDGVTHVELSRRVVKAGRAVRVYYEVHLVGAQRPLLLVSQKGETRARAAADQSAKYLNLELHDKIPAIGQPSGDVVVVRRPQEIGVAVGERLRTGLENLDLPARPADLITQIESLPNRVFEVTFPRQGFVGPLLLMAAVGSFFVAFMTIGPFIMVSQMEHAPPAAGVCMMLPGLVLGVALVALVVGSARTRVRLYISPTVIEAAGGLWRTTIAASQLEEVRVEGDGGDWTTPCFILIRSASASARVGGNRLRRDEGEYIAALIKATVASGNLPKAG